MLIDKVRIDLSAGSGGPGHVHFEESGRPYGGNGGDGGDIYFQGSTNVHDFKGISYEKKYRAEDGSPGGDCNRTGKNGDDLIINVPLKTIGYDLNKNKIFEISKPDEKFLISKGGRGGLGNCYFKRGQIATLRKTTPGKPGEELQLFLELELQANVIFIGLPNAGKSSMLNAMSNASVKVAPYPFTTLEPNLAKADNMILMDLPGLIEGTSEGKGLGSRFFKHAKSAKLIAHFISLESTDLMKDYETIRQELKKINPELIELTEIIILNKKDILDDAESLKAQKAMAKKTGKEVYLASSFDYDSVKNLIKVFKQNLYQL